MRCIRVENQDGDSCVYPVMPKPTNLEMIIGSDLEGLIEEGSIGDSFKFTVIEMTQEEFDALPEFTGW